jgi:hypothetical protein
LSKSVVRVLAFAMKKLLRLATEKTSVSARKARSAGDV